MSDESNRRPVAVVTGASSGIGAATARALAERGFELWIGARRRDRLAAVAEPIGATALVLDVTDPASVEAFAGALPDAVDLLVNNAGGALGLEPVAEAVDERWATMYETNVLGTMRLTRALLPRLLAAGEVAERGGGGHVINVGSTASIEVYPGGAGYTAAKHALSALTGTLRLELLGRPVRVTQVNPGLVETEFSVVRFDGDRQRADGVYRGMTPLVAEDVADCIVWAATRPPHVNVDEIVVRPRDQATSTLVHREQEVSA